MINVTLNDELCYTAMAYSVSEYLVCEAGEYLNTLVGKYLCENTTNCDRSELCFDPDLNRGSKMYTVHNRFAVTRKCRVLISCSGIFRCHWKCSRNCHGSELNSNLSGSRLFCNWPEKSYSPSNRFEMLLTIWCNLLSCALAISMWCEQNFLVAPNRVAV